MDKNNRELTVTIITERVDGPEVDLDELELILLSALVENEGLPCPQAETIASLLMKEFRSIAPIRWVMPQFKFEVDVPKI